MRMREGQKVRRNKNLASRHATHNPHKRAVQASNWTKLPAVAHCPANHVYNTKAFTRICGKILRMER